MERSKDSSELPFLPRGELPSDGEVRHEMVELPDGSEAIAFGDPELTRDYFHLQGENDLGMQEDCGLTACGDVLNQFGVPVSENDVVHNAVDKGCCEIVPGHSDASGGTTIADQAQMLSEFGVPAHPEVVSSLEQLAEHIESGRGEIIEMNAGLLWNDPQYYEFGVPNHAVAVEQVFRDPTTGAVKGIAINDSGRGDFCRFLPADHPALLNYLANFGPTVVTDVGHA